MFNNIALILLLSMFLTLKPNSERSFVPYAPNSTAQSGQRIACLNCHAKKLKCEGQKTACDRCSSKQLQCVYPRNESCDNHRNRKTKRSRNRSYVATERQDSDAPVGMRPEPECLTKEVGVGSEGTNSPSTNLVHEEFLYQFDTFDFESYWQPLGAGEILGATSSRLIDMEFEFSTLQQSSINNNTDKHQSRLQDGQHDNLDLERSTSAGNPTSNYRKAVGQETKPINSISSNAQYSSELSIIPESPHRMASVSGSSQTGLEDSYQAARKQNLPLVSTLPVTCHCSSMILEAFKSVGGESVDGETDQIDQALNMAKTTLDRFSAGLACQTCNYKSDFIMLITVTLEKAINSFDRSLKRYRSGIMGSEWKSPNWFLREKDGSSSSGEATQLCTPSSSIDMLQHGFRLEFPKTISFGEYCVDQGEEQLLLVSVLVKCLIEKLARFCSKIQALAARRNWEMHRMLLEQVERKIRALYDEHPQP